MNESSAASLADGVGTVLDGVGSVGKIVWDVMKPMLDMISENAIIFIPVGFAILGTVIGIAISFFRKNGLRGRR